MDTVLLFSDVTDVALKAHPFGVAIYGILVFFLVLAVIALSKAYLNEKKDNKQLNKNVQEMALKFAEYRTTLVSIEKANVLRKEIEDMGYNKLGIQVEKMTEMLRGIDRKIGK